MPTIELKHVTKTYGRVFALKDMSVTLDQGKVIGLLGPNGSGKTTLIKIITGMLKDYQGAVFINQIPWSYHFKANISYLPDVALFEARKTIKSLKSFFLDVHPDFNETRFNALMDQFQIDQRKRFKDLSKGNKEKLQLAFVLAREASIYIFDEPIGGVDPLVRDIILETIMKYKNPDTTLILATHQIHDVQELFDEVIFLYQGNLLLHRNTKHLVSDHGGSLINAYKEAYRDAAQTFKA